MQHGKSKGKTDKLISSQVYPVIDNDLARDNIENDMTAADRADVHISRPEENGEDF